MAAFVASFFSVRETNLYVQCVFFRGSFATLSLRVHFRAGLGGTLVCPTLQVYSGQSQGNVEAMTPPARSAKT